MKTFTFSKILVILLLIFYFNNNSIAQFVTLTPPCNSQGFHTVCCGNDTYQNKLFIHEPGYPGYMSLDGGLSWTPIKRGVNADPLDNCAFIPNDCYNKIDLRKHADISNTYPGENNFLLAVGKNKTLLCSSDNGNVWVNLPLTSNLVPDDNIPLTTNFIDCTALSHGCKMIHAISDDGYVMTWDGACSANPQSLYLMNEYQLNIEPIHISTQTYVPYSVYYYMILGKHGKMAYGDTHLFEYINTGIDVSLYDCIEIGSLSYLVCGASGTLLFVKQINGEWITTPIDISYLFPVKAPNFCKFKTAPTTVGGGIYLIGDRGSLLLSNDNGTTWSLIPTGTETALYDIDINETSMYIVGESNLILKKTF